MRFASLGSGSAGNCMVIEHASTCLLLDCGFGERETLKRLQSLALDIENISGILITHEHDDHAKGVFKLAAKYNIPIWLSHGTKKMTQRYWPKKGDLTFNVIDSCTCFEIQDIQVQPYPVPHDAREPVQFTFSDGENKLGVLTDAGHSTPHIETVLNDCDALVLECNHDVNMLQTGPYSYALKKRVGGRFGHLDNDSAAQLLAKINHHRLKHIVAAHLSVKNNTEHLAKQALSHVLNCKPDWIGIAKQKTGFDWRALGG